jgi:hypothetical protein
MDFSEESGQREAQLKGLVQTAGSHPALWAWEVPDEALWNCWYGATQWRREFEPAELRKEIASLSDPALAKALAADLETSAQAFEDGDFLRGESLADSIWTRLGKVSPTPQLNLSNAPERAAKMRQGLQTGYQAMKQMDPKHPIWMNHAPRNQISQLAAFNQAADVVGCDIYPVPEYLTGHSDLADRSLASVGAYTDRMQAAAPEKPVWMVLQGFGWADLAKNPDEKAKEKGRRPSLEETRYMAYDALVHQARGILYWGTAYIEKDSQLWKDLLSVVKELADHQDLWSAPDVAQSPEISCSESWGSLDRGIRILGKQVKDRVVWLVVNEANEPLHYTLKGLKGVEGTKLLEKRSGQEGIVKNGELSLTLPGHGVQILEPAD